MGKGREEADAHQEEAGEAVELGEDGFDEEEEGDATVTAASRGRRRRSGARPSNSLRQEMCVDEANRREALAGLGNHHSGAGDDDQEHESPLKNNGGTRWRWKPQFSSGVGEENADVVVDFLRRGSPFSESSKLSEVCSLSAVCVENRQKGNGGAREEAN